MLEGIVRCGKCGRELWEKQEPQGNTGKSWYWWFPVADGKPVLLCPHCGGSLALTRCPGCHAVLDEDTMTR